MSTTDGNLLGQVRRIWADVLGVDPVERVSVDENFLEAGGNSMLLVMLWEELQPLAARPVKLSELFQHGTVRAQAELLAPEPDGSVPESVPAAPVAGGAADRPSLLGERRSATAPVPAEPGAGGGADRRSLLGRRRSAAAPVRNVGTP